MKMKDHFDCKVLFPDRIVTIIENYLTGGQPTRSLPRTTSPEAIFFSVQQPIDLSSWLLPAPFILGTYSTLILKHTHTQLSHHFLSPCHTFLHTIVWPALPDIVLSASQNIHSFPIIEVLSPVLCVHIKHSVLVRSPFLYWCCSPLKPLQTIGKSTSYQVVHPTWHFILDYPRIRFSHQSSCQQISLLCLSNHIEENFHYPCPYKFIKIDCFPHITNKFRNLST